MKRKQLLTKTLLIAAMLFVGQNVWGDITPVSKDYSDGVADWTSANTERYTVGITDGILSVNPVSNGNNGTTITGTTVKDKVPQGTDFASSDDYTLSFDLKLNCGNNNTSSFYIYDGTNKESAAILALKPRDADGTNWKINGNNHNSVKLSTSTLYTFKLSKSGQYLYLTITPAEGGNPVFAQQTINVNSSKGGLGNMIFSTGRYYAGMSINNVVLRAIESTDIPASAKTYSVKAKAGDTVLKTYIASGAAAAGASVKVSCLNWAVTKDGKCYTLNDANVTNFTRTFTKGSSDNEELVIEYKLDESIAYYTEAEDLSGWYAQEQKADYSSYGLSKFLGTASKSDTECSVTTSFNVSAGKYDICASIFHRTKDGNVESLNVYEVGGGDPVSLGTIGGEAGKQTEATIMKLSNQTLTDGSDIKIAGTYNSSSSTTCFDYIYLQKSAVSYTVEYKCGAATIKDADASRTASWGTHVTLTSDDKVDVTYDGHLYRYTSDNASSQEIASDGTTVVTVNFEDLGAVATITYTLNVGTSAGTTIQSSTSTTDGTNITGIDIDQTNAGANGTGASDRTAKLDIKTGANGETFDSPTNYVLFKYSVASGKKFTPTNITIKVANVGGTSANDIKYKATLSDGVKEISGTYVGAQQDGTVENFVISNDGNVGFTGDVTLKLWAWQIGNSNASAFRMGTPLTITGLVNDLSAVELAIIDCKTYETSEEFATYIDGGTYASAAEVYAAHSAWQIAKAKANGSTDYSKAILNRTFELHNTSGWTIYGDARSDADTDKDKYGEVEYGDDWSQYYTGYNGRNVSQNIASLPAGVYRLTSYVYSWGANNTGATVRLFANGSVSDNQGGTNEFSTTFDFAVTGNEESIKIGIGGVGQGSGDNTWGAWGYRVKNFTLTKISESMTISSVGWATYCSPYALDFSETGAAVYTAARNATTNNITLSEVSGGKVPANTGVILYKDGGGDINPAVIASANPIENNELVGIVANTTVKYNPSDGVYNYIMEWDVDNNKPIFSMAADNGATLRANKAYLSTDYDVEAGGHARALAVASDAIETTGINNVQNSGIKAQGYYNLNGQRVSNPTKGLYIVNGRKVVVK